MSEQSADTWFMNLDPDESGIWESCSDDSSSLTHSRANFHYLGNGFREKFKRIDLTIKWNSKGEPRPLICVFLCRRLSITAKSVTSIVGTFNHLVASLLLNSPNSGRKPNQFVLRERDHARYKHFTIRSPR